MEGPRLSRLGRLPRRVAEEARAGAGVVRGGEVVRVEGVVGAAEKKEAVAEEAEKVAVAVAVARRLRLNQARLRVSPRAVVLLLLPPRPVALPRARPRSMPPRSRAQAPASALATGARLLPPRLDQSQVEVRTSLHNAWLVRCSV